MTRSLPASRRTAVQEAEHLCMSSIPRRFHLGLEDKLWRKKPIQRDEVKPLSRAGSKSREMGYMQVGSSLTEKTQTVSEPLTIARLDPTNTAHINPAGKV